MKYFVIVAFALIGYVTTTIAHNHISWGIIGPSDVLLDRQIKSEPSKWLRIVEQDYIFNPQKLSYEPLITGIQVKDLLTDGKGGYATIYSGGPGHNNVTIHLESQRSQGLEFIIEVYGI